MYKFAAKAMNMSPIIETLNSYLNQIDKVKTEVSDWSVGKQIVHCTKVIYGICTQLERSDPNDYVGKFNLNRMIVFTTGKIPRGRGKAPKAVMPSEEHPKVEEVKTFLLKAEQKLQSAEKLPANSFFVHPVVGNLNLKQSIKFIKIHTNHHISIIKDIIK